MKGLFLALALLSSTPLLALPGDVSKLIQEDRYAEALARVEELLKASPQDAELAKLRTELQATLGTAPTTQEPSNSSKGNSFADLVEQMRKEAELPPLPPRLGELVEKEDFAGALQMVKELLGQQPEDTRLTALRDLLLQMPLGKNQGMTLDQMLRKSEIMRHLQAGGGSGDSAGEKRGKGAKRPPSAGKEKNAPKDGGKGEGASSTAGTAKPAQLTPEQRLELNTVRKLLQRAQAAPQPERAALWEQILERTSPLVGAHPQLTEAWVARASAALGLDRVAEGAEAARQLKTLGALESGDAAMQDLLTELNVRGWFKITKEQIAQSEKKAAEAELAELLAKLWEGKWKSESSEKSSNSTGWSKFITLSVSAHPELKLSMDYSHFGSTPLTDTSISFSAPGESSYTYDFHSPYNPKTVTGSGRVEMSRPKLEQQGHLLAFEVKGRTSKSDNTYYSHDSSYVIFYDPSLGDSPVFITPEEAKEPIAKKREIARSKIATKDPGSVLRREGPPPTELLNTWNEKRKLLPSN